MKEKRFSVKQIAGVLKQAEVGLPVRELVRQEGISEQTCYRWKKRYVGLDINPVRQLQQLQEENQLSELARQWLDRLVRFVDIPQVFVYPRRRTVWRNPNGPFTAGKNEVGLEWVGFHGLRHFRATQWLMNGVDVNTVKELLGHSDIHTTMRYVHYIQTHATKAVRLAQERSCRMGAGKNGKWIHGLSGDRPLR